MATNRNDKALANESGLLARTTTATVLIVAAMAALAITSLIRTHQPATAQTPVVAQAAPTAAMVPSEISLSVPLDSGDVGQGDIGHFAFGYLVFDWDPQAPGGVPGFDSWPPGSRR
jgi:hypothetical protein